MHVWVCRCDLNGRFEETFLLVNVIERHYLLALVQMTAASCRLLCNAVTLSSSCEWGPGQFLEWQHNMLGKNTGTFQNHWQKTVFTIYTVLVIYVEPLDIVTLIPLRSRQWDMFLITPSTKPITTCTSMYRHEDQCSLSHIATQSSVRCVLLWAIYEDGWHSHRYYRWCCYGGACNVSAQNVIQFKWTTFQTENQTEPFFSSARWCLETDQWALCSKDSVIKATSMTSAENKRALEQSRTKSKLHRRFIFFDFPLFAFAFLFSWSARCHAWGGRSWLFDLVFLCCTTPL